MQNGKPCCYCPTGPCRIWRQVLVDVISETIEFETIERIREQDDTVLLMEQHALAAFEIADFYVRSLASATCWAMHPSCSTSPSSPRPTWKASGESDRL